MNTHAAEGDADLQNVKVDDGKCTVLVMLCCGAAEGERRALSWDFYNLVVNYLSTSYLRFKAVLGFTDEGCAAGT